MAALCGTLRPPREDRSPGGAGGRHRNRRKRAARTDPAPAPATGPLAVPVDHPQSPRLRIDCAGRSLISTAIALTQAKVTHRRLQLTNVGGRYGGTTRGNVLMQSKSRVPLTIRIDPELRDKVPTRGRAQPCRAADVIDMAAGHRRAGWRTARGRCRDRHPSDLRRRSPPRSGGRSGSGPSGFLSRDGQFNRVS
jgi:hypothetical protein